MKLTQILNFSLACLLTFHCQITDKKEAESEIEKKFLSAVTNQDNIKNASLLVHSDKLQLHVSRSFGTVFDGKTEIPAVPIQPFHTASIGKMFTSVLILKEIEKGKLSFDTKIINILGQEFLKGLFVFEGTDHADKVTIKQLLNHTSGMADYFESTDETNKNAKAVIGEISKNPNQFWKPNDLVEFTRKYQKAIGKPGETFAYSDTGYVLLGLILEKLNKQTLEDQLKVKIFAPLQMNSTYMHLRSQPISENQLPLSHMFLGEQDVTNFKSISADWAGGGLVSTTEDLLKFQKALVSGRLISSKMYEEMKGTYPFHDGIFYGLGLMTVDYGEMLFLMKGTPLLYGHSGLLSTLCFYAPEYDTHIIANFGSTDHIDDAFEMMFHLMRILKDVNTLKQ
ncbi:class A beta-lactamase-related serine hydrolase [Leptospira ognonensis]|uniref:Class A beta-lactamase-related serine hydrolase n=1 Tax=Leptospira ognonensis TaxID=2484945 RepID=A0A4R9JWE0_9LEPT|nr:serine hydrolase domain-containing protein [Leptospira ognonensis]TGL57303.1 class A beta-lactamase-related serine hydrolase [Leptospira ognonensis]